MELKHCHPIESAEGLACIFLRAAPHIKTRISSAEGSESGLAAVSKGAFQKGVVEVKDVKGSREEEYGDEGGEG
jgi:hypothetical protein